MSSLLNSNQAGTGGQMSDSIFIAKIPLDGFQATPMLQILDRSGNAASLLEHPVFSTLQYLQELYLRRMQLHEVPSDILSLQQLRILELSQNSLQSVPVIRMTRIWIGRVRGRILKERS